MVNVIYLFCGQWLSNYCKYLLKKKKIRSTNYLDTYFNFKQKLSENLLTD